MEVLPEWYLWQRLSGVFEVSGEVRALEHAASGREDERCDGVQVVEPIPAPHLHVGGQECANWRANADDTDLHAGVAGGIVAHIPPWP